MGGGGDTPAQSWGPPDCCRGDQRPQVTSDLNAHGALQEESFECGGYGVCADVSEGAHLTIERQKMRELLLETVW